MEEAWVSRKQFEYWMESNVVHMSEGWSVPTPQEIWKAAYAAGQESMRENAKTLCQQWVQDTINRQSIEAWARTGNCLYAVVSTLETCAQDIGALEIER